MRLRDIFKMSIKKTNKIIWIIFIPILLDVLSLFSYEHIFKERYIPIKKDFFFKIGIIDTLPSVDFILEDFPKPLFKYNLSGFTGIIDRISFFNIFLIITIILILCFIKSGYLSVLNDEKKGIKNFFILGNKHWGKFLILNIIEGIPISLMFIDINFIFLAFFNIVFLYVPYSFIIDECSIKVHFKRGINFLFNHVCLTIKMSFYFGVMFSLLSIPMYLLIDLGILGIILDIVIVGYLGTVINKSIIDIYK